MRRTTGILIIIILALGQSGFGQQPKQLRVKGTYIHQATKVEFPESIDAYQRVGVYSFDKKKENIGCTYKYGQTTLSIYLYPAGNGTEGRLRNQYLQAMQDMANVSKEGISAQQGYDYYKKDGYKVSGFTAISESSKSELSVFECGEWFFKIRITTNSLDTADISKLKRAVLNQFEPTRLVKISNLHSKATVHFAPGVFRDSLMLGSAMGSAFKKIEWAIENVDSLERAAGFPDLYLGLHTESLKEFVQFEKRQYWDRQPSTTEYLNELNLIINSGFLEEFIMEQFSMIMIVPTDIVLDFEGYEKWQLSNPTKINLNSKWYLVSYNKRD
ncbi:MAG TPA: hypothetical protein VFU05_08525 [Cyclobacteriaceae bacterium]|nr:hypothetical protein [Cyclobacteriaceae bacterium]